MTPWRLDRHPILSIPSEEKLTFYWNRQEMTARPGEVISSALFANGIHLFGHHHKDGAPQGIFCANGQCAQCMVIANGLPVKSCMTKVESNMIVESLDGLPELPKVTGEYSFQAVPEFETDVLIIGGGPAGLAAASQLGQRGIRVILVDDKDRLGGKLVLQTHKFFGSISDCHAGTRGIDIAGLLENDVARFPSVKVWINTTALFVFSDQKVGVITDGREYKLVKPRVILVATGAREKSLVFAGNTLPGVYGAGAFQTLVNRDLVKPSNRLFIAGGGNVGLIAAYHALQAGIEVVGLVEALPKCGGYKVHEDKIRRLGVPIYTCHTIISANGEEHVESVTIAQVDERFKPVIGTEKTFSCDTILIAVGLNPVNEFIVQAEQAGLPVFAAGDAKEIAEASSAMFSGKIAGLEIARYLGREAESIPADWYDKATLLKSHPGPSTPPNYDLVPETGVGPVFHCTQEIPCNPCTSICEQGVITIPGDSLLGKPLASAEGCIGCFKCLLICPGLAITLVDYRKDPHNPIVTLPYEVYNHEIKKGDRILLTDYEGLPLTQVEVINAALIKDSHKTQIVRIKVAKEIAKKVAGFRIQGEEAGRAWDSPVLTDMADEAIVCRCERVTVGEIRRLIRGGARDLNQIKAYSRAGMGACGYKTCEPLMLQLFRQEGIDLKDVTLNTIRPVFVEVPLAVFAGQPEQGDEK
ncbi:MAG: FAD-dependent oxidoreductase [Deltaproteobacteria bacterium]|nr:FAD-dependent oxidoreductase [Deltaproteobacteria bacterium]